MLACAAACGRGSGVSDSAYVATVAELYRINGDRALDSARRVAARRTLLQQQGLTAAALERAAEAIAEDPDRAAAIAAAIDRRWRTSPDSLRRLRRATPPPTPSQPTPVPQSSAPRR